MNDKDEVMAIKTSGQVTRSRTSDVPHKGRDTMGVKFVGVSGDDTVVAIARNAERPDLLDGATDEEAAADDPAVDVVQDNPQEDR